MPAGELGDEVEAFLRGDYERWLAAQGLPIRNWVHLNAVAHRDPVDPPATDRGPLPASAASFADAARTIEAVLRAVVPPDDLPGVQRTVLVPLELELLAGRVMSPRAAVEQVVGALFDTTPPIRI